MNEESREADQPQKQIYHGPTNCRQDCKGFFGPDGNIRGVGLPHPVTAVVEVIRYQPCYLPPDEQCVLGRLLDPENPPHPKVAVTPVQEKKEMQIYPLTQIVKNFDVRM